LPGVTATDVGHSMKVWVCKSSNAMGESWQRNLAKVVLCRTNVMFSH